MAASRLLIHVIIWSVGPGPGGQSSIQFKLRIPELVNVYLLFRHNWNNTLPLPGEQSHRNYIYVTVTVARLAKQGSFFASDNTSSFPLRWLWSFRIFFLTILFVVFTFWLACSLFNGVHELFKLVFTRLDIV